MDLKDSQHFQHYRCIHTQKRLYTLFMVSISHDKLNFNHIFQLIWYVQELPSNVYLVMSRDSRVSKHPIKSNASTSEKSFLLWLNCWLELGFCRNATCYVNLMSDGHANVRWFHSSKSDGELAVAKKVQWSTRKRQSAMVFLAKAWWFLMYS